MTTITEKLSAALRAFVVNTDPTIYDPHSGAAIGEDAELRKRHESAREAIAEYDAQRECVESDPAAILVHAYAAGAATGAGIDWSDVDKAHVAARAQLGPERCAAIDALYADKDD